MNICVIGCWYKEDIYSHHFHSLMEALRKEGGIRVKIVTSNCNCFSSCRRYSIARQELLNNDCHVIKLPYAPVNPNKNYGLLKYYIVKLTKLNFWLEISRGLLFFRMATDCEIIHFDQVLRSFGFLSFVTLLFLGKLFGKKIVVTVHELDPLQDRFKRLNRYYNRADRIIVFSEGFKERLARLGIEESRIEVVPYAVEVQPQEHLERDQFVYFGGHNLLKRKGFETVLNALKILKSKERRVRLLIYVGHGCNGFEEGERMASDLDVGDCIEWSKFLHGARLKDAYQKSIACLVPYTGGSGRYPATCAMANGTPVIATRKASLPEYLEELGIYVGEDSPEELADAMLDLWDHPEKGRALGPKLRKRVDERFSPAVIAKEISRILHGI